MADVAQWAEATVLECSQAVAALVHKLWAADAVAVHQAQAAWFT
jgi:hypothetical protein